MTIRLDKESLVKAVKYLEVRDRQLKRVISRFGPPPLWEREEGFQTLIYIILEQQVSLASAKAAYEKLLKKMGSITSVDFLELSDAELKTIGKSEILAYAGQAALTDARQILQASGFAPRGSF